MESYLSLSEHRNTDKVVRCYSIYKKISLPPHLMSPLLSLSYY
jgi:hypothetical protein